jgi:hypothetical protein
MEASFFVHLFHILIVGGLFLYVGIKKTDIPNFMYSFLLILGIIIIAYHGFKVYKKLKEGLNPWVNYIHIFMVGPLLVYIGLNKEKTQRLYFEILLMLGFASIGYHGYYLVN